MEKSGTNRWRKDREATHELRPGRFGGISCRKYDRFVYRTWIASKYDACIVVGYCGNNGRKKRLEEFAEGYHPEYSFSLDTYPSGYYANVRLLVFIIPLV